MALIKCYECSKEISDTAKSCPHCGAGKARECHECSQLINQDLDTCPNCGAEKQTRFSNFSFLSLFNNLTSNKWLLLTLLLILFFISGLYVWYGIMILVVDGGGGSVRILDLFNVDGVIFHSILALCCLIIFGYTARKLFTFWKPTYLLQKQNKTKVQEEDIIEKPNWSSTLHTVLSLILLTSFCYLVADILHTINLVYYKAIYGLDLNQHPDAPTTDFISIFTPPLVAALIISFIYFIIRRLLNKETSFLRVFYITSYLMSLLLIIYYVSLFINMQ